MPHMFLMVVVFRGVGRPWRWPIALLVSLVLSLGVIIEAQAATTWRVCASGCAYSSIKAAIAAPTTLDGDTLAIGAGTYTEPGITVNKSLTFQGAGAAATIVQAAATPGMAQDRVFTIASGVTVTLREMTIRYGSAISFASDYSDSYGGGLFNDGTLTLINSIVSGNSAIEGGGLFTRYGTAMLTSSTISGNSSSHNGGGIMNNIDPLTLTNSTVSGNSTGYRGGGLFTNGPLTLTNSTVSGNSASHGGGLYNTHGPVTLSVSTISGNSASHNGGGLASYVPLTLTTSLVANNQGGNCAANGSLASHGYNLDSDGSCHLTTPTDLPGTDPLLGPLQKNGGPTFTHALLPGSPAIDAIPWGTNGCGTTLVSDQRWQARPQPAGGHCDIGAYEVEVAGEALGGWVTGFTPQTVVCTNVTTGQQVTLSDHATAWDCEAAGVAVSPGDHVSILARGSVDKSATDVGGAVAGMQPSSAGCTNLTTGQQVTFQHMVGATAASCVAAGLVVQPGNHVQISVQGAAE
jgi:hypothetical protein